MNSTSDNSRRLNQLNILKWCLIGIALLDIFMLLFFNITANLIQKIMSSGNLPPNMTAEELKEAHAFFDTLYWPFNIVGLIHLPLTFFTFFKIHQKKWHALIPIYAGISLLNFPLGSFLGVVLIVFLYQAKGKELFQK